MAWSDVPYDLLSEIANRIDDRFGALDFRSVCRSWRAAAAVPKFPNSAILSPILPYKIPCSKCSTCTRSYLASNVYLIQPRGQGDQQPSPKFWLAMIDEIAPGRLVLRSPLSTLLVNNWPPDFQKSMRLSNLLVTEVKKSISFTGGRINERYERILMLENCGMGQLSGISFASCRSGVLFLHRTCNPKFCRKLGFIEDIVRYKGNIFLVDAIGRGYVVNSRESVIVSPLPRQGYFFGRLRLVESKGNVYLLVMYNEVSDLEVYKFDENTRKWVGINDLGDLGFFIARDCSFALSSKQCAGFQGNCVYVFENAFRANKVRDVATIGNEDWHRQISIFRFDGQATIENEKSFDFLWPPPTWLYACCYVDFKYKFYN